MQDISAILRSLDEATEIVTLSLDVVKKHSVLAMPDVFKILSDVLKLLKDFKAAVPETKGLDGDLEKQILDHAYLCMQKIVAALV